MTASFQTLTGPRRPVRIAVVGVGGMGEVWLDALQRSSDVDVVAVLDIDVDRARDVVAERALDVWVGATIREAISHVELDAVLNVTVPEAHLPVTVQALDAGLHVLGEKPITNTLHEALTLVAAVDASDRLVMVSQSRRYNAQLVRLKAGLGELGRIGVVTTEFFRAPRFGGFRDAMAHPLLRDMAIHPFDTARYLLDAEPVSVVCEEFNPAWSWYAGSAAAVAHFEMSGGAHYVYTGSWCSPGLETSWNGAWRLSAERGSATWEGDSDPIVNGHGVVSSAALEGVDGALAEFIDALWTGRIPMGEVHDNLMSFVMVEAAVAASVGRCRIDVADFIESARSTADPARTQVLLR
jgi:predicted dehydrogenase